MIGLLVLISCLSCDDGENVVADARTPDAAIADAPFRDAATADAPPHDAATADAPPRDAANPDAPLQPDAAATCTFMGESVPPGESRCVCDGCGELFFCDPTGYAGYAECQPGLYCFDEDPACSCYEVSDGYCPELTDICDDVDPDCAPGARGTRLP